MGTSPTLVWFRQDLRLADHPALQAAVQRQQPVIPVFLWSLEEEGNWPPGAASRWWLHQSLQSLEAELRRRGSRLTIRRGPTLPLFQSLIQETGADAVFWSRRYEPAARQQEARLQAALEAMGRKGQGFEANLLFDPQEVRTQAGKPFQVFTPFWKACLSRPGPPQPLAAPTALPAPERWPETQPLESLGLDPQAPWTAGLQAAWQPGPTGAAKQWASFLEKGLATYAIDRDRLDLPGTSRISPHLHFGEISPRQIWYDVHLWLAEGQSPEAARGAQTYLRELGWREFAYHLLFHFPHTPDQPLRPEFQDFPWLEDDTARRAWQKGRTGYPVVDAGLRELWATGWMHNRARMVAASFLVKDLLISWQEGARWFWDTLVDADLANNTLGWQWTAGCGADAAPFFRIFNPLTQGRKFDPHGDYVRRWVPEWRALPDPWLRPGRSEAGEVRGQTYPRPLVDHAWARERALAAFASLKGKFTPKIQESP